MRVNIPPDCHIITVCHYNDILRFRTETSDAAQSPRRTGLFPASLPNRTFRVPAAADSSEMDFSHAFYFDILQAALGCNN